MSSLKSKVCLISYGNIFVVTCMQIFQINNIRRQNASYSTAVSIAHDDDDVVDACIAKIIIIFRSQCEVEIVENL